MGAASALQCEIYTPCSLLEQSEDITAAVATKLAATAPPTSVAEASADIDAHIRYLAESVAAKSPELFCNYVQWADETTSSRGVSADWLRANLEAIAEVLRERSSPSDDQVAIEYLDEALGRLGAAGATDESLLRDAATIAPLMLDALLACQQSVATDLLDDAIASGMSITDIYLNVFQPVLREVGRLWQVNTITVAQEHYCSAAIQLMMGRLASQIFATERIGRSIVLACVGKELHEIGLRMVADILELSGWRTQFLGANVPTPDLCSMVRTTQADVLCLSMTLTSHMSQTHEIIQSIRAEPDLQHVKVLVGGYPFLIKPDLWKTIGADGHAADAAGVHEMCLSLVQQ